MRQKTVFRTGLLLTGSLLFLMGGCKKDDKKDADTSSAADNAFAQGIYDDAGSMSDQAAQYGTLYTYRNGLAGGSVLSQCATVTLDTSASPKLITIDFGTSNCLCLDQRYRRGKIKVSFTGGYRDSLSSHQITFEDYYVNDYHVQGMKTVTNMGHNSSGHLWFTVSVTGIITAPNGDEMTWTSSREREWVAGEPTVFNWQDDIYHITGTASGASFSGIAFSAVITEPLVVDLSCYWIRDGVLEFTPSVMQTRVIDYGYPNNGDCDNKAQVTIGSNTWEITLR